LIRRRACEGTEFGSFTADPAQELVMVIRPEQTNSDLPPVALEGSTVGDSRHQVYHFLKL
jgi:hypothetical protein